MVDFEVNLGLLIQYENIKLEWPAEGCASFWPMDHCEVAILESSKQIKEKNIN